MTERDIFIAALQLDDPAQRRAYLDEVCAQQPDLRRLVEQLLRLHEGAGDFLEQPAESTRLVPDAAPQTAPLEVPGTLIGPYKFVQQIGEGGMGTVWMAQQTEPVKRLVAVKLIKAGMDSKQVIARFEAERQALALMDHPNIARVLDAGTTSAGRPYFAMDLVRGFPITKYCDDQHLTPRQRLELFLPVCQAIQHAHQKGIIHRDLKPSNVLIALYDGKPVPKVIDFGVAKATGQSLTEKTLVTGFGSVVGTLEYMSPEQAEINQLDIDTRSDIYSLGVVLYELLAGSPPFTRQELKQAGMMEMLRVIREQEPSKPSTKLSTAEGLPTLAANRSMEPARLTELVRGDLDWIVMKALEKDRSRRYETANGFAMDVQRYLVDEPVLACPPSAGYRLRKFLRRHKGPVLAAAAVVLALVAGVFVSTWQAVEARHATGLARASESRALEEEARARRAEADRADQLWRSYLIQAHANRQTGRPGRRFDSLDALKKGLGILRERNVPEAEYLLRFRNEAIACLAHSDLRVAEQWEGLPQAAEATRNYHPDSIWLNVDPQMERYLRSDPKGSISVRRIDDDREVAFLPGTGQPVRAADFSPNGRFLYVDSRDDLRVWNLNRPEVPVHKVSRPAGYAFRPDGRQLVVSAEDGSLHLLDLTPPFASRCVLPGGMRAAIAVHPDGQQLAACPHLKNVVEIRELTTGRILASLPNPFVPWFCAWSPDGKRLAVCGEQSPDIYLWDVETRRPTILSGHFGSVTRLAFSHVGDLLASKSWDGTIRLWDVKAGRLLSTQAGNSGWAPLRFSRDDRRLAFVVAGSRLGLLEVAAGREFRGLVSRNAGKPRRKGGHNVGGDFSLDGQLLATPGDEGVRLWDVNAGEEIGLLPIPPRGYQAVFAPDRASLLTSGTEGLRLWPLRSDPARRELHVGPPQTLSGPANFFQWAPGDAILAALDRGPVVLLDRKDPARRLPLGTRWTITSAVIDPGGNWVAVAAWHDPGIQVWDARTGQSLRTLPTSSGALVFLSPEGRVMVVSTADEFRLFDTTSWQLRRVIPRGLCAGLPNHAAFSRDGTLLAISVSHSAVRLLDPAAGVEVATLQAPHEERLKDFWFSPDGDRLALSYASTEVVDVWDLRLIRSQLADLGLDWDRNRYPFGVEKAASPPPKVIVDMGR